MIYHRVNGVQFSIKNPDEKKEFMRVINEDAAVSKNFKCIGVEAEQFTGKIKSVLLQVKGSSKVNTFTVAGEFPTLKLVSLESNHTYFVEFPKVSQAEVAIKKPAVKHQITLPKKMEVVEVKEEKKPVEEVRVEEPAAKIEELVAEAPVTQEVAAEEAEAPAEPVVQEMSVTRRQKNKKN